ncbi:MAG TPA: hypothetical protein VIU40_09260 [Geobacteraceae bacterium]
MMTKFRLLRSPLVLVLLGVALLGGCGTGNTTTTTATSVPSSATIFFGHSAVVVNRTVYTWGYNGFGQLGYSPTTSSNSAVSPPVKDAAGIQLQADGVSCGGDHTIAFMNHSTVRTWGYNAYGQLGSAQATGLTYSNTPVAVTGLRDVVAVSAGGHHNLALTGGGNVFAWGYNASGQLGLPGDIGNLYSGLTPTTNLSTPWAVIDPLTRLPFTNITKIAAGGSHSLALQEVTDPVTGQTTQTLWAWGANGYGQLGKDPYAKDLNGNSVTVSSTPQEVKVITGRIIEIAAGGAFSMALTDDGRVWTWGYNGFGQLGWISVDATGTVLVYGATPTPVTELTHITQIAAGLDHAVALVADGTLRTWGYNGSYSLGNNDTSSNFIASPVQVKDSTGVAVLGGVQQIMMARGHHTVVKKEDGTLWAWGANSYGQLGDMTTTNRATPVKVIGF